MPKITKFHIWDTETQDYIHAFVSATNGLLNKATAEDWIYSIGIVVLQNNIEKNFALTRCQLEKEQKATHVADRPITITDNHMHEIILLSFLEFRDALHQQFGIGLIKGHDNCYLQFDNYLNRVVKHTAFLQSQAQAYTFICQKLRINAFLTPENISALMHEQMELAAKHAASPESITDIASMLVYLEDYKTQFSTLFTREKNLASRHTVRTLFTNRSVPEAKQEESIGQGTMHSIFP